MGVYPHPKSAGYGEGAYGGRTVWRQSEGVSEEKKERLRGKAKDGERSDSFTPKH
jgi:hypothetical protein